jgi:hypothetical protein
MKQDAIRDILCIRLRLPDGRGIPVVGDHQTRGQPPRNGARMSTQTRRGVQKHTFRINRQAFQRLGEHDGEVFCHGSSLQSRPL